MNEKKRFGLVRGCISSSLDWVGFICFRHLDDNGRKYVSEQTANGQEGKQKS